MSALIPPAKNYQSPLISIPARWQNMPSEGARYMVVEALWGTMGLQTGNNSAIYVNLAGQGAQTISQIVALSVDNSLSGADVQFVFPDTAQTYTVPAYTPQAVFPVFTGQTQFYMMAIGVSPGDITRLTVHNYMPPVMSIPTSEEQNAAVFNAIPATAPGSTQLVAATVSGRLEVLDVSGQFNNGGDGQVIFTIQDGTGKIIAGSQGYSEAGVNYNVNLLNLTGIRARFNQGLQLVISASNLPINSAMMVNAYYRVP